LKTFRAFLIGLALPALLSCASYQNRTAGFRDDLRRGNPDKAAEKLKEQAYTDGRDQVVFLLDYATAQQIAGNYDESIKAFAKAGDLTEIKDYHSITKVTASLLTTAAMVQYKGDDYEKVLINAMQAINYLMQNKLEEAQVYTRKLNNMLYKFKYEGKKDYDQNPFASYLSALIWEAGREWDSAYIEFKKTYELNPKLEYLKEDLIRGALNAQRQDEAAQWKAKFPGIKPANLKDVGDLVLIYQQGWGPVKRPHPASPRVPDLGPTFSLTQKARIEIEGGDEEDSQVAMSVTDVAIKTLKDQYAGIIAGRVVGVAAKAVVADQIRQKNELLGQLAWIGMNAADQADLRQWVSLPSSFQIAKMHLKPGKYKIRFVGLNGRGDQTGENSDWREVTVQARKKTFLTWRSLK
jgi:hypothetical protein